MIEFLTHLGSNRFRCFLVVAANIPDSFGVRVDLPFNDFQKRCLGNSVSERATVSGDDTTDDETGHYEIEIDIADAKRSKCYSYEQHRDTKHYNHLANFYLSLGQEIKVYIFPVHPNLFPTPHLIQKTTATVKLLFN